MAWTSIKAGVLIILLAVSGCSTARVVITELRCGGSGVCR